MRRLMLAAAIATLSTLPALAADKPASVKLCYDNVDVYPWVVGGNKGLNITHLRMVEQKVGIKFELVSVPWKRCLNDMKQGTVDGAFAASFKPDRLELGVYPGGGDKPDTSKMMMMDGYTLYKAKGSPVTFDGKTISNLKEAVGAQAGYSIVDQLKAMGVRVDDGTRSADDTLRKLVAGRLSAAALLTLEGDESIKQAEFADKVEKVSPPLVEKPYYLIFSKQFYARYKDFANNVWDQIAAVRESPEFKKAVREFK
jgi:polar amino acid transport system substrate-binding protein